MRALILALILITGCELKPQPVNTLCTDAEVKQAIQQQNILLNSIVTYIGMAQKQGNLPIFTEDDK